MDARGVRRSRAAEEEESYFISMADMMVGLLFVFIILLLYFALQYQQEIRELSDAGAVRKQILVDLEREIERADPTLDVQISPETGVMTLPAAILFGSAEDRLSPEGQRAVLTIGNAMLRVLPCYTLPRRNDGCAYRGDYTINAIFIEGHTDQVPLTPNGRVQDNLDLSALRATNTFRQLITIDQRALLNLTNRDGQQILSVSGYADARQLPRPDGVTDDDANRRNRRIDLRFLMDAPITSEQMRNVLMDNRQ